MRSCPTPITELLSGTSFAFSSLCNPLSHFSVSYDWKIYIDNHLDDKVLLDLGILQTGFVSQELPGKEPPLADYVYVFLFF